QGTSCDALPAPPFDMIPVVKSDRGGQITYHGKGQLIIYLLLDIKRLGIGPKKLVKRIERALMALLAKHKIVANTRPGAPGVYVDARKIAALGLRIKRGMTYHGLSLNIDMDLAPFNGIDPCGYAGLEVTQLADLLDKVQPKHITDQLIDCLIASIYSSTEGET
ncbi:MAG: lipoyl(octanoyl) transferase LipB, partial [Arenicellales bacterium]